MIDAVVASIGRMAEADRIWSHFLAALLGGLLSFLAVRADAPVPDQPLTNSLGMKFVPAGTDGVLFAVWDVRVKDFEVFVDATSRDMHGAIRSLRAGSWKRNDVDTWATPGFPQTKTDPVIGVDGNDVNDFCTWLTQKEQADGTLKPSQVYRVPTRAEWLKAAGTTQFPWGDNWPPPAGAGNFAGEEARDSEWGFSGPTISGYNDGFPRTSPVGSFNPNAYGLYDMGGDAVQVTRDPDGSWFYLGSSWREGDEQKLKISYRMGVGHPVRESDATFRLVLAAAAGSPNAQSSPAPSSARVTPPASVMPGNHKLTQDEARAVVLIQGDDAEGTGFLVRMPDGPVVVTNLHVLANNSNLKIMTNSGAVIPVLSVRGASDRDLALLAIKDAGYSYLEMAKDISQACQPGDEVVTPGNSEGGEVMLNTVGKILGIGPERIEFDNPIYHGNSGGPVFETKSGKVLGVVTEAVKVDVSDELDKASFASRSSAIGASMRYFGLRLDTVPSWLPLDSQRFQTETTFLDQFDKANHALDSYLNAPNDDKPEDNTWRSNPDIVKANTNYFGQANGGDAATQMDALRQWLADMYDIANINMDAIQNPRNFYSFDQEQARNDIEFRKALKTELDGQSANLSQLASLPRKNN